MKGKLLIVGGSLASNNREVYESFIEISGGKENAIIGIISVASKFPIEAANSFKKDLIEYYGLDELQIETLESYCNENVGDEDTHNLCLNKFTSIWFTGGDQRKIESILFDDKGKETHFFRSIIDMYNRGGTIAGTSAGAAVMCSPMITGGECIESLFKFRMKASNLHSDFNNSFLTLGKGLGIFEYGIIDQHFGERDRLGRLVIACSLLKKCGYGIDENTAIIVDGNSHVLKVLGEGALTIIDLKDAIDKSEGSQIYLDNIKLHYLLKGDCYNINSETLIFSGKELDFNMKNIKVSSETMFFENSYGAFVGFLRINSTSTHFTLENLNKEKMLLTFMRKQESKFFLNDRNSSSKFSAKNIDLCIKTISTN